MTDRQRRINQITKEWTEGKISFFQYHLKLISMYEKKTELK